MFSIHYFGFFLLVISLTFRDFTQIGTEYAGSFKEFLWNKIIT